MKPKFTFLILCALIIFRTAHAAPPNILFILIDDMGYGDLSCYGEKRIQTQHIDQLAHEGIRFTQFYVNAPICSPSRTALTTGQFPARWRMTSYLDNRQMNQSRGMPQWLPTNAPTLARALQQAGYATGHFGKWHMGGQRDVGEAPLIAEYGFDKTITQFEGLGDRILPILDAYDGTPPKKYSLGSDKLGHGNITWLDRSQITTAFASNALAFIQQAQKNRQPFYVNLWPDDVHSPFYPPKALRGDASKKQLYLGVVKAMDDQLAGIIDYIRNDRELRTNTLIIVASDNGPEPGAGSPGPFRGHKGNLYEGGVREPFITWGPGLIPASAAGTVNDTSVIAGIDLLPSVAKIAGAHLPVLLPPHELQRNTSSTGSTPEEFNGAPLQPTRAAILPLPKGEGRGEGEGNVQIRQPPKNNSGTPQLETLNLKLETAGTDGEDFSQTFLGKARQIRTKPLFWVRPPDRPGDARAAFPDLAMREGDWKFLIMEDGSNPQLYNLSTDPGEKKNLVKDEPETAARLKKELLDWRKSLPIITPPKWNPSNIPPTDKTPS